MQIIMDDEKIKQQGQYNAAKIHQALDAFLIEKLGFKKAENGFYLGDGSRRDFSYFGIAFNTLRKKPWFVENIKTWLYFNSDASDDPEDFVIEDFKAVCLESQRISA